MKRLDSLDSLPQDLRIWAGIDIIGNIKQLFEVPLQMPGCLFLLCTRGICSLSIHLHHYNLCKNSMAVIFPNEFIQIKETSPDCRFLFVGFSELQLKNPILFSRTIEYTLPIFETPVTNLKPKLAAFFYSYIYSLIKAAQTPDILLGQEQVGIIYTQLIMGLGAIYRQKANSVPRKYNRNQEIVKDLIRLVTEHYRQERNISFYADKMHLSPQHLSTTIKKTTGKTLTDIISTFVIRDAQGKLRSTELTIQEIAYSLNFTDISFFGKYFKRYTGVSPKQYRNME